MTRRKRDQLYAGASGRATLAKASKLAGHFRLMPKADGIYSTLTFDAKGNLGNIIMRGGKLLPAKLRRDFHGLRWVPDSTVVAELECLTENANRIAEGRGYRMGWIFDAIRIYGRDISKDTFGDRRDSIMRGESWLVNEDTDTPWTTDKTGRAHDEQGRFTRRIPKLWRRLSVLPSAPIKELDSCWADWVEAAAPWPTEGLVACNTRSRLGAQGSKKKIKRADSIDAVVIAHEKRIALVNWVAAAMTFTVHVPAKYGELEPGAIVEIVHEGCFSSGLPKFPRIARRRIDLGSGSRSQGVAACAG